MRIKIRLSKKKLQKRAHAAELPAVRKAVAPSVVRVYFPARGFACTYFNDKFDLQCGDIVYVDGKLEGLRGFVTEVSYNFKIKLSEYKRVIAQASTEVKGKFYTETYRSGHNGAHSKSCGELSVSSTKNLVAMRVLPGSKN